MTITIKRRLHIAWLEVNARPETRAAWDAMNEMAEKEIGRRIPVIFGKWQYLISNDNGEEISLIEINADYAEETPKYLRTPPWESCELGRYWTREQAEQEIVEHLRKEPGEPVVREYDIAKEDEDTEKQIAAYNQARQEFDDGKRKVLNFDELNRY